MILQRGLAPRSLRPRIWSVPIMSEPLSLNLNLKLSERIFYPQLTKKNIRHKIHGVFFETR